LDETKPEYSNFSFTAIKPVQFTCTVSDDSQSMFRPAIYGIRDIEEEGTAKSVPDEMVPQAVVSMIGCYRNVARKGGRIRVSGMLEKVDHIATGNQHYQVVVGSGLNEEERVCPI